MSEGAKLGESYEKLRVWGHGPQENLNRIVGHFTVLLYLISYS